jgi:HAD superfamily hydrolase (TIGR01509 family)
MTRPSNPHRVNDMPRPRAILWDVDGTLAETERDAHRVAFNVAFETLGLSWRWDGVLYGQLLRIAGGRERLLHFLSSRMDAPPAGKEREALSAELHRRKNHHYAQLMSGGRIPLREGVLGLMQQCRDQEVLMGIATTTSRSNLVALLSAHLGAGWPSWFAAVVCGEDVTRKKPDPEVYALALAQLRLAASDVVAIEDSPDGTLAARRAGIPVVVTRSVYFSKTAIEGATAIGPGLHTRDGWTPPPRSAAGDSPHITLDDLAAWL